MRATATSETIRHKGHRPHCTPTPRPTVSYIATAARNVARDSPRTRSIRQGCKGGAGPAQCREAIFRPGCYEARDCGQADRPGRLETARQFASRRCGPKLLAPGDHAKALWPAIGQFAAWCCGSKVHTPSDHAKGFWPAIGQSSAQCGRPKVLAPSDDPEGLWPAAAAETGCRPSQEAGSARQRQEAR